MATQKAKAKINDIVYLLTHEIKSQCNEVQNNLYQIVAIMKAVDDGDLTNEEAMKLIAKLAQEGLDIIKNVTNS